MDIGMFPLVPLLSNLWPLMVLGVFCLFSSQSGKLTLVFLYGTGWNANPGKELNVFFRLFDEQFGSVATVTQNGGMQRHQLIGRDTLITLFTFVKGCEVPIETLFQKLDPARHICLVRTPLRSQLSRPTDFDATENWEKPFGWANCFQ